MADAPWQCPQCGTVNEPSANACRGCGRWPSLFDLERGAVATTAVEQETWSRRPIEVDELHPEIAVEPELAVEPVSVEPIAEPVFEPDEEESSGGSRGRLLRSLIVPIAFAIYILISIVFGDRGS